jgi:hypothetical protein
MALVIFGHLLGTTGFVGLSAVNIGGGLGALSFLGSGSSSRSPAS